MCECGCTGQATRYKFPAPGKAFYLLSLFPHCANCDVESGITIELVAPGSDQWKHWKEWPECIEGDLPFQEWKARGSMGAAIVTGLTCAEFIAALSQHLVGVDSKEMGDDGTIDADGADVILDEMYSDAQIQPRLVAADTADKPNEEDDAMDCPECKGTGELLRIDGSLRTSILKARECFDCDGTGRICDECGDSAMRCDCTGTADKQGEQT